MTDFAGLGIFWALVVGVGGGATCGRWVSERFGDPMGYLVFGLVFVGSMLVYWTVVFGV